MSPVNTWTFLLVLCINSIVYSKTCTWLQDGHKDLPKQMLTSYKHMIPENETSDHCQTNRTLHDTCLLANTRQVESAAIMVREFLYQTIQLYTKHQEKLVSNQEAWENFQEHLYDQASLTEGCISRTTKTWPYVRKIRDCFSELEKIVEEQNDAVCARGIIHANISPGLQQVTRLPGLIQGHFKKTP